MNYAKNTICVEFNNEQVLPVEDPELGHGLRFFWKIFLNGRPNHFFTSFPPKIYPFFMKLTFVLDLNKGGGGL